MVKTSVAVVPRKPTGTWTKGLADVVRQDPFVIRLRFEPSGRDGAEDIAFMSPKPNHCVVCGSKEDLTRHHIIPYTFIHYMTLECKMDIVRDIYGLCVKCHVTYERHADRKKKEMAEALGMSYAGLTEEAREKNWAASSAMSLLRHGNKIPQEKKDHLLQRIRRHLRKEEITEEDLIQVVRTRKELRDDSAHNRFAKHVALMAQENYSEFAREWREHFVATMNPQFMPELWRIDRKTENVWIPSRLRSQNPENEQSEPSQTAS
jgi:5-methylcytosine-specific restriction endonuclease McrA